MVSSALDTDYYKLTMRNFFKEKFPTKPTKFEFINRTSIPLGSYISKEELNEEIAEIKYYIDRNTVTSDVMRLPNSNRELEIFCDDGNRFGPLSIAVEGVWPQATLWEVPLLATVNELYFKAKMKTLGLSLSEVEAEGERRLRSKLSLLKNYPELKFVDFGTRRRFSRDWQEKVLEITLDMVPANIIGTSNVELAQYFHIPPVGTMAHECFMGYSRLFGDSDVAIRDSQHMLLQDWWEFYCADLSIALTDTFGTKFFFDSFTPEQAENWNGLRQDSGDPFTFGYAAIAFYKKMGIDPKTKTIVFSDGLTFEKMIALWEEFHNDFNVVFGIGTNLTNDMGCGLNPISIVIKLSEINGLGTVKLSDNLAKAMGSDYNKEKFIKAFNYENIFYEETVV